MMQINTKIEWFVASETFASSYYSNSLCEGRFKAPIFPCAATLCQLFKILIHIATVTSKSVHLHGLPLCFFLLILPSRMFLTVTHYVSHNQSI